MEHQEFRERLAIKMRDAPIEVINDSLYDVDQARMDLACECMGIRHILSDFEDIIARLALIVFQVWEDQP